MNKNGYNDSIMDTEDGYCYLHENDEPTQTIRHEIYHGTANRSVSKEHGLWVNICPRCHEIIHSKNGYELDMRLKLDGQRKYEETHSREEFMKLIGRNYIED